MESIPYDYDLKNCWIEKNDIAPKKKFINENTIIVLVDDFVGIGETAIEAVEYVYNVIGKDSPP